MRKTLYLMLCVAALALTSCGDKEEELDTISGSTWVHTHENQSEYQGTTTQWIRVKKLVLHSDGATGTYYFNHYRNAEVRDSLYTHGSNNITYSYNAAKHNGTLNMATRMELTYADGSPMGYMFNFDGDITVSDNTLRLITHSSTPVGDEADTIDFIRVEK